MALWAWNWYHVRCTSPPHQVESASEEGRQKRDRVEPWNSVLYCLTKKLQQSDLERLVEMEPAEVSVPTGELRRKTCTERVLVGCQMSLWLPTHPYHAMGCVTVLERE